MIMAVGPTVSKIGRGQTLQGSGHNEIPVHYIYYWTWTYTKWPVLARACALRVLLV